MSNRRSIADFPRNEAGLVDEFIGTAYDVVKEVHDNLDAIRNVGDQIEQLDDLAKAAVEEAMVPAREEIKQGVDAAKGFAEEAERQADRANAINVQYPFTYIEGQLQYNVVTISGDPKATTAGMALWVEGALEYDFQIDSPTTFTLLTPSAYAPFAQMRLILNGHFDDTVANLAALGPAFQAEFDASQQQREAEFDALLLASGLEVPVPYVPGLPITRNTQTVSYLGDDFRFKPEFLPLVTTDWLTDSPKMVYISNDSLRSVLQSPAGGAFVKTTYGTAGSVVRDVQQKLNDKVTPEDFGALANGSDATDAFTKLEADVSNITIDLGGRTYTVTKVFKGNRYVNGRLKIGLQHYAQQMDRAPGVSVHQDTNYNSIQRYNIAEINGDQASRGAQAFCFNERSRSLFLYEGGIVSRYDMDAGIDVYPLDQSLGVSPILGHQGLACELLPGNTTDFRLWCTSAVVGRQAVRFAYAAGQPITSGEEYVLFDNLLFANSTSSTPTVSSCNRYLIAHGTRFGNVSNTVIRVWDLKKITEMGPGDHTKTWLYEWDTLQLVDADGPLQGTACDGATVWLIAGGTGPARIKKLHAYTLDGNLISREDNFTVGKAQAALDGDGTRWEPEGLAVATSSGGGKTLYVGMLSGQPGVRRFRIYGVNLAQPVKTKSVYLVGNTLGSIGSVTSTGRKYIAFRSAPDLNGGAGMNLYANGDNNGVTTYGGWGIFTKGSTRLAVSGEGNTNLRADAGTPSLTLNGNGSGTVQELRRNNTEIGRIHVSTVDVMLAALDGAEVRIGASPSIGVAPTANWRNRQTDRSWGPMADGIRNIGSADFRPGVIYAASGAINTSDQREKTAMRYFTPVELQVAKLLVKELGFFKFLAAVREKGEEAREHVGMYVQTAIRIFQEHNLNPFDYSFICYDSWEAEYDEEPAVYEDRDGQTVMVTPAVRKLVREAGDRYSFRHDGLIMFMMAGQEQRMQDLEDLLSK